MGSLLIVTGPPGAGKSTVSAELANRFDRSALVAGDDFFAFLARGAIEPWLPESADQNTIVTEAAARATARFVADYDTIYDGVVGPWFLSTFAVAGDLSELDYVMLLPSADTCAQRVANRQGHGFTDEPATRKIHQDFVEAEIDSKHVIDTTSLDLQATVAAIHEARSKGELRYVR